MLDIVENPEDRFSHNEALISIGILAKTVSEAAGPEIQTELKTKRKLFAPFLLKLRL